MIKTIKPNLASISAVSTTTTGPAALATHAQKLTANGPFNRHWYQNLITPEADFKKAVSMMRLFQLPPRLYQGFFYQPRDDILKYSTDHLTCFKIVSQTGKTFSWSALEKGIR